MNKTVQQALFFLRSSVNHHIYLWKNLINRDIEKVDASRNFFTILYDGRSLEFELHRSEWSFDARSKLRSINVYNVSVEEVY